MRWWHKVAAKRPPDYLIGDQNDPQTLRWCLVPRNGWFNVYLHKWLRSDQDESLHDHPYFNVSVLLEGHYLEEVAAGRRAWRVRRAWRPVVRLPSTPHAVRLQNGTVVWSLFITGPRVREWGFHCPKGWTHFKEYLDRRDKNSNWNGCEK